jgi:hypothetical protein
VQENKPINDPKEKRRELIKKIIVWFIVFIIVAMMILIVIFNPKFYTFVDMILLKNIFN